MRLTDAFVRSLKADGKQRFYRDPDLRGFGIRINQSGSKTYALMHSGTRTVTTIGRANIITLQEARTAARRLLAQKTLGNFQPRTIKFSEALDLFVTTHCSQIKTGHEYQRMLKREFFPALKSKTLDKITPYDIQEIIDRLKPSVAYHSFTYLKAFFNWCIQRSYLEDTPLRKMKKLRKGSSRDRVLSDLELGRIWRACEQQMVSGGGQVELSDEAAGRPLPESYRDLIKLLILWGARRGEVAALKWEYIKSDRIVFPAEAVKNNHEFEIPLLPMARAILEARPKISPYVFPARRLTDHLYVFAKLKKDFDTECGVKKFTHHDLRRTFRTVHARIGTMPHIGERLIGHVSHSSGVQRIYERYQYFPEMFAAQQRYEKEIRALCMGCNPNEPPLTYHRPLAS